MQWYKIGVDEVLHAVNSSLKGLTKDEREDRLRQNGENTISQGKEDSKLKKFFSHFHDL